MRRVYWMLVRPLLQSWALLVVMLWLGAVALQISPLGVAYASTLMVTLPLVLIAAVLHPMWLMHRPWLESMPLSRRQLLGLVMSVRLSLLVLAGTAWLAALVCLASVFDPATVLRWPSNTLRGLFEMPMAEVLANAPTLPGLAAFVLGVGALLQAVLTWEIAAPSQLPQLSRHARLFGAWSVSLLAVFSCCGMPWLWSSMPPIVVFAVPVVVVWGGMTWTLTSNLALFGRRRARWRWLGWSLAAVQVVGIYGWQYARMHSDHPQAEAAHWFLGGWGGRVPEPMLAERMRRSGEPEGGARLWAAQEGGYIRGQDPTLFRDVMSPDTPYLHAHFETRDFTADDLRVWFERFPDIDDIPDFSSHGGRGLLRVSLPPGQLLAWLAADQQSLATRYALTRLRFERHPDALDVIWANVAEYDEANRRAAMLTVSVLTGHPHGIHDYGDFVATGVRRHDFYVADCHRGWDRPARALTAEDEPWVNACLRERLFALDAEEVGHQQRWLRVKSWDETSSDRGSDAGIYDRVRLLGGD